MKRRFLVLLSTIFALAAISLVIIQVIQTKRSAAMSDNLFNISVNNAMDEVFSQLDQMKVEDFISQQDRFRILRYKRIEELNEKMQNLIRNNSDFFYDEERVDFGVSTQDSIFVKSNRTITTAEESIISQYNTLLNSRNRLMSDIDIEDYQKHSSNIGSNIDINKFNFPLLDSIIREELLINGVDIQPKIGILQSDSNSLIYCSDEAAVEDLKTTPFKFNFHTNGIVSSNNIYIVLTFPSTPIILKDDANFFTIASICMILVITFLFILSLRTIWSQRKLDEMKTDFINNMTHEIKTPISTISLACEMLKDDTITNDSESRRNFINIISDENRRMRVLIETLLQSAKMASKKVSINCKEIDFNNIVQDSAQSFQLAVKNKQGKIDLNLHPIEGSLYADELHVSNMIHNLVDNAIKYSPQNPHVIIKTYTEDSHAVFSITDNGIGIAKEDQKHIFEKFYRVSTGDIHNVKGFGIGLNYVYQVVLLHNGKIDISSELGKGTTFTIHLPLT